MRGLFSKAHPPFEPLLVIESGPREIVEEFLRHVYEIQKSRHVDVLTCYAGVPSSFDPALGQLFSIHDPAIAHNRRGFLRGLRSRYAIVAILCTGSPVLQKWKWIIALRSRAKIIIVNEHGGFYPLDYAHRGTGKMMLLQRVGLGRTFPIRFVAELLLVPFAWGYLLLYAMAVHTRAALRTRTATGGGHRRIG